MHTVGAGGEGGAGAGVVLGGVGGMGVDGGAIGARVVDGVGGRLTVGGPTGRAVGSGQVVKIAALVSMQILII